MRQKVRCYTSPFVVQEIERGGEALSQKRLAFVADMPVLALNEEVEKVARAYFTAINLLEKAKLDAFHLALAAWYKMDYVLSWNCRHIVSGRVQRTLWDVNARLGMHTPVLCTPEELMEV